MQGNLRGDETSQAGGTVATRVGKEIAEHAKRGGHDNAGSAGTGCSSITEAGLLSIVALLAAWSGYAAAKWSTESRVGLAKASAARTEASRATLEATNLRNFDSSTFGTTVFLASVLFIVGISAHFPIARDPIPGSLRSAV